MIIIEDSRQQPGKHENVHKWFRENGIEWERSKCYVGDYVIAHDGCVAVDTKKDVVELAMDLHKDHERFRRECIRAQNAGIQLIVLIEEQLPDGGLVNWKPPARLMGKIRFDPAKMRAMMITMQDKYGVRFRFCDKKRTGEKIIYYLTKEARNE